MEIQLLKVQEILSVHAELVFSIFFRKNRLKSMKSCIKISFVQKTKFSDESFVTFVREVNRMNKTDLISKVAELSDLSKKDAGKAVEAVISAITEALQSGDKVQLVGFGNFEVKERSARTGRNPQTGEPIEISSSKFPTFKPGKALKDVIK